MNSKNRNKMVLLTVFVFGKNSKLNGESIVANVCYIFIQVIKSCSKIAQINMLALNVGLDGSRITSEGCTSSFYMTPTEIGRSGVNTSRENSRIICFPGQNMTLEEGIAEA